MLNLTPRQTEQYLSDLADVIGYLARTLIAVAELADRTPGGAPPEGMLNALAESWETLDSRFRTVYCELYGYLPSIDDVATYVASTPEEGVGTQELQ